jgi:hypothetical protein
MANEKEKKNEIKKVYVFLTDLPDDRGEGIVSMPTPHGIVPLVALDDRQRKSFSKMAQELANESGRDIWAVAFTEREEVQRFECQMVQIPKTSIGTKVGDGGFKIGD